jgi:hypothetical protein
MKSIRVGFALPLVVAAIGCSSGDDSPPGQMLAPVQPGVAGAGAGGTLVPGDAGRGATVPPSTASGGAGGSVTPTGGGAPAPSGASGGGAGMAGGAAGSAGSPTPGTTYDWHDPGTSPWMLVPSDQVAEKCKMDPAMLMAANSMIGTSFAVVRYGELCHESGSDSSTEIWSATKTFGALMTGMANWETRDIPNSGPGTGRLSDLDRAADWLGSVSYNADAQLAHVLSMVGHDANLDYPNRTYSYDTVGAVQINSLASMVREAIAQDAGRLGGSLQAFIDTFLFGALGLENTSWTGTTYAYTCSSTLHDMARVGLLILHRGMWSGKRLVDERWIYKMTHPSFEDANTAYGYLTWLNAAAGATGPGGAFGGTAGDPCAPYAVWPSYPHGTLSNAPDCGYGTAASCEQQFDAGIWSAQGLGGQFIVGHPGLDLVIVAKNFSGSGGPTGLWAAIRPALLAHDPMFMGNEEAFCEAYSKGDYAPDLNGTPMAPAD